MLAKFFISLLSKPNNVSMIQMLKLKLMKYFNF